MLKNFEARLRSSEELVIGFEGEFDYDEDRDEVHPRNFRDGFLQSDGVAVVLKHDGRILRAGNLNWPNALTGQPRLNTSKVEGVVRDRIASVWGTDREEYEEERVVGEVGGTEITREMTIFCPSAAAETL